LHLEIAEWCHDIHARPETALEQQRTAALAAKKLQSFGLRTDMVAPRIHE
jgi:metal-dependent amidase/aminoacylase/carboxypeptidase family protein